MRYAVAEAHVARTNARRRNKPVNGFLESLIDPIDWLSETIFSILILLLYILAIRNIMLSTASQQLITVDDVNELLIGALGAVIAWGMIDGIMYALFAVFERDEKRRLLEEVQAARTNEDANEIIADDMDYLLEPILGEEERTALYGNILSHLQKSKPRNIRLKGEDLTIALGHVVVAILAVIPSVTPENLHRLETEILLPDLQTRTARAALIPPPNLPPRPVPVRPYHPTAWLQITLYEGKKHQVRRLTAAIGHPTLRLVRVAIGSISLGDLMPGEWRNLSKDELVRAFREAGIDRQRAATTISKQN